jgi:hypothetical protein
MKYQHSMISGQSSYPKDETLILALARRKREREREKTPTKQQQSKA